jgi:hypothetical protein
MPGGPASVSSRGFRNGFGIEQAPGPGFTPMPGGNRHK